jgi:hypothetical protein
MKNIFLVILLLVGVFTPMIAQDKARPEEEKWIQLAKPEVDRQHLEIKHYEIAVQEEGRYVYVTLSNPGRPQGVRGQWGKYPELTVKIDKNDPTKISSYFNK